MTQVPFTHFGRYRVLEELGRGAMGVVYRAEDQSLQRQVAVKTMRSPDDPTERAQYEARFRQEAKSAGGLNHPAVITIYDLGREGDWLYIAMELLQGTELRDLMLQGRLPLGLAVDIAAQVADGLAAAHERGVVHRDIKPSNIMVLDGHRAKIMDFGIARMQSSEVSTQTGMMLGSPRYMAPEQVLGQPINHRCDIFSLGSMLYEMAAGTPPFSGESLGNLLHSVANSTPPAPSQINPAVPALLDLVIAKAMQKNPAARYQDARELARDLGECRALIADSGDSYGQAAAQIIDVDIFGADTQAHEATQAAGAREHTAAPGADPAPTRTVHTGSHQLTSTTLSLSPSRHFDSAAALQRLMQSASEDAQPLSSSAVMMRDPRRLAWRLAFAVAALGAALIAWS